MREGTLFRLGGIQISWCERRGKEKNTLMPYAMVSSVRFSFSTSVFISGIGIEEPAAIPVLNKTHQHSLLELLEKPDEEKKSD